MVAQVDGHNKRMERAMTQQSKMKPIERVKPKTGSFIMTSQGWVKVLRGGRFAKWERS